MGDFNLLDTSDISSDVSKILKINDSDDRKRLSIDSDVSLLDKDWVTGKFLIPKGKTKSSVENNRFYTSSAYKVMDSSFGGNIMMNPKPQYTRYSDIRHREASTNRAKVSTKIVGATKNRSAIGMGRYYSEVEDDNQQLIYFEFGVKRFNTILSYITNAVSPRDSILAVEGRSPIFYDLAYIGGIPFSFILFGFYALAAYAIKFMFAVRNTDKIFSYYYMKPDMYIYWNTVNEIMTSLSVELGFLHPDYESLNDNKSDVTADAAITEFSETGETASTTKTKKNKDHKMKFYKELNEFRNILPGLITKENFVDMLAIASRPQRKMLAQREIEMDDVKIKIASVTYTKNTEKKGVLNKTLSSTFSYMKTKMRQVYRDIEDHTPMLWRSSVASRNKVDKEEADKYKKLFKSVKDAFNEKTKDDKLEMVMDPKKYQESIQKHEKSFKKKEITDYAASVSGGFAFAIFAIDYTGPVSETFSNTTSEIGSGNLGKNAAKQYRELVFNTAGGGFGAAMGQVIGGVKDIALGFLAGATFDLSNAIYTVFGGSYVDMPKKWDDSSISFPNISHTVKLTPCYGNTLSKIQNIYSPLSMFIAAVAPLSTGKASYTSPLLCSMDIKGVQRINLGMMTSLTISRGEGHLGFDKSWKPTSMTVTFSVTDFSTILPAPVESGSFLTEFLNFSLAEGTPFGKYIGVLGGRDALTTKYSDRRKKIRLSVAAFRRSKNFSNISQSLLVGNFLNSFFTDNINPNMHKEILLINKLEKTSEDLINAKKKEKKKP